MPFMIYFEICYGKEKYLLTRSTRYMNLNSTFWDIC